MKILATLGDSLIVGINGRLHYIGSPPPCHGYQNCCICPQCQPRQRLRELKKEAAMAPKACIGFTNRCHCSRCQDKVQHLRRQHSALKAHKASKCECGGGVFEGQQTCWKCGKAARAA